LENKMQQGRKEVIRPDSDTSYNMVVALGQVIKRYVLEMRGQ
jgi:hypothetical protein